MVPYKGYTIAPSPWGWLFKFFVHDLYKKRSIGMKIVNKTSPKTISLNEYLLQDARTLGL
jgi:hypothetical protein